MRVWSHLPVENRAINPPLLSLNQVHLLDQLTPTPTNLISKSYSKYKKHYETYRKDVLIITNKKSNLPRELPDNMIYWIRCETKVKDDCSVITNRDLQ